MPLRHTSMPDRALVDNDPPLVGLARATGAARSGLQLDGGGPQPSAQAGEARFAGETGRGAERRFDDDPLRPGAIATGTACKAGRRCGGRFPEAAAWTRSCWWSTLNVARVSTRHLRGGARPDAVGRPVGGAAGRGAEGNRDRRGDGPVAGSCALADQAGLPQAGCIGTGRSDAPDRGRGHPAAALTAADLTLLPRPSSAPRPALHASLVGGFTGSRICVLWPGNRRGQGNWPAQCMRGVGRWHRHLLRVQFPKTLPCCPKPRAEPCMRFAFLCPFFLP